MATEPARKERPAFRRPQNTIEYAANAPKSVNLHLGRQYRNLLLWLSGTLNVTVAAASVVEDSPFSLIKKIELMVNGNVPVKTISGKAALERTAIRNRVLPSFVQTGTGVAAHPFSALLELPLWLPEAGLAMDASLLDATARGGVTGTTLEVTWGDQTDLVTGGTKAFTVNPTVQVVSHDLARKPGDPIPRTAIHRERTIVQTVAASNQELKIDLKSGDTRRILSATVIAREAAVRSNAIVNSLRVASDTETRYQVNDEAFHRAITDLFIERDTNRAGVYHVDIAPRNLIGHSAEMSAVSEYNLFGDVTAGAASELEIIVQELIGVAEGA
jgi:hypothetical protein